MSGAIHPLSQYAFMAWCLVKAQGQPYIYIYLYLYPVTKITKRLTKVSGSFLVGRDSLSNLFHNPE
jgi:hypothetical protein